MSTLQTINLGNPSSTQDLGIQIVGLPPIPKPEEPTNKKGLLSDDEIDNLINSQIQKPQPKVNETIINNLGAPLQEKTVAETTKNESTSEPKEEETLKFDLNGMNGNLDEISKGTRQRIKDLIESQNKLKARTNILEKFIVLDEKELAIEVSKPEPNQQKIIGIRRSILNQTELLGNTLDILLKFEGSIQSWTKQLMDIEKDKIAAFHKLKSLNKEQAATETDINEVLGNINMLLKTDPSKTLAAIGGTGSLSISGYSGKKFNQ